MAVLFLNINPEDNSKISAKIEKHLKEKETDLSYKWAKYALSMAIQLNFNEIKINPYTEDQGAAIHFLSKQILLDNKLDQHGYIVEDEDERWIVDEDDTFFNEERITFEAEDATEAAETIEKNEDYVHIMLDLNKASEYIGGYTTPTAKAATAIYSATKEHANSFN